MKRYLPVFLYFSLVNIAHGQETYAELNLESNKIDDIQAFEVGDSVFLTYTDKDVRRTFWIDGSGKTSQVYLTHVGEIRLCGIQKNPDTTFLYYLKEEDQLLRLSVLKQSSHGGNIYSGGKPVNFSGDPIAIYTDDQELIAVSYEKKYNSVEIISVRRGIQASRMVLQMPEDFRQYSSSSGFITSTELTTIAQGSAPTKIYKDGRSIIFTIDEDRFAAGKSATRIIRIDLSTGEHVMHTLPGPDDHKFSSFYLDNNLFRLATSYNSFQWSVYDVQTGNSVYTKNLDKEKSLRNQNVLLRMAESQEVWHVPLYGMIGDYAEPSIIVERIPGTGNLRILTGTFQNSKAVALPAGGTPLAMLTTLVIKNVINQLEAPPGINKYFSLTGNVDKGFDFEPVENNSSPSLRQIIDDYEISRTSGVPKNAEKWSWFLLYKGYLQLQDGALGIYHEKRKEGKKLILLKYTKR
jgi:hypothetical protein